MHWTLRAALGAVAAAGLVAGAAETASARTAHETTSILNFGPHRQETRTMKPRSITLAAGRYTLYSYSRFTGATRVAKTARRGLHLKGRYIWTDELTRWGPGYIHHARLDSVKTSDWVEILYLEPGRRGNGTYAWGSVLGRER